MPSSTRHRRGDTLVQTIGNQPPPQRPRLPGPGCARGAWLPLMYEAAQTGVRYRCSNELCAPVFRQHRVRRHELSGNLIIVGGGTDMKCILLLSPHSEAVCLFRGYDDVRGGYSGAATFAP